MGARAGARALPAPPRPVDALAVRARRPHPSPFTPAFTPLTRLFTPRRQFPLAFCVYVAIMFGCNSEWKEGAAEAQFTTLTESCEDVGGDYW